MGRTHGAALLTAAAALTAAVLAAPAAADPATAVLYPGPGSATLYSGEAFDACTAPPLSTMTAWLASPYRAVAVYVGGVNRTCAQPELTAAWVRSVSDLGWRLIPVYKGLQPACGARPSDAKIDPAKAAAQGKTAAADALAVTRALGIRAGSAVYLDIENYSTSDVPCRTAVLTFASGFTRELHRTGLLSGVYANLSSGALHFSAAYSSTSYARPDALWLARWDMSPSLTGWAGIPNSQWAVHQRLKQYRGDHTETYGGVSLAVDSDRVDGPVATVGFRYRVTSRTGLLARSAPSATAPGVSTHAPGTALGVICSTPGSKVGTTTVWDKLSDGSYVTAYYTRPESTGGPPLVRCAYPAQTTVSSLTERSGPGSGYAAVGALPAGSLAWVYCQRVGSTVGSTAIWDRMLGGRWVTDYYVATRSATSYSPPIPRC